MKKLLAILMAFVLMVSLVACGGAADIAPTDEPTVSTEETNVTEATTEVPTEASTEAPTEPHEHEYSVEIVAATCTEDGYTLYTCSCGDTYTEKYIEAEGHDWGEWETTKEATATAEGTAQRTCTKCGEVEIKNLQKNDGHTCDYTEVVTKEASCSASGVKTYTCKTCGHTYTESIAKLAHTYKDIVTEPTCTAKGYTTHTCSICSYSYNDSYTNVIAHDYTSNVTTAPTCAAVGVRTYTCQVCNKSYTESIEKTAHSYTSKVVAPGCGEKGYTLYSCVCGDSYKENYTEATGHSWGEWETTKNPTYFTTGVAQRTCSKCGEIETKTLAKTNHTCEYSSAVTTEASCYAEGVRTYTCTICGVSYTEAIAKTAHNYTDIVTNPTCTESGYTTHKCSVCGDSYTDTTVAATGHSYSVISNTATCASDGIKTEQCQTCGDTKTSTSSATEHLHTTTETDVGSCGSERYIRVYCDDCGNEVSRTLIPATSCSYTTKKLSTVTKELLAISPDALVDAGLLVNYVNYTDWNVNACEKCGYPDLNTVTYAYDAMTAATIMLGYVNDLRREVLGEGYDLVLDSNLVTLASNRAVEISTDFRHVGLPCGENIAMTAPSISAMFDGWKNSPGHYANMVGAGYKYFGFAMYVTGYKSAGCGVQLFSF